MRLGQVGVDQLIPESMEAFRLQLAVFPKTHASVSVFEFLSLVLLMKRVAATRVFEFGTYKGVSITQLALNLPPESLIYTLDLPEDSAVTRLLIPDPDEAAITVEKGKGTLVPPELKGHITFLQQDSATFDESPYVEGIDFVFVDGAHSYDYVKNDSEKGWRMLCKGGIIAWHDVRTPDPDVVRFLVESSYQPIRITNTALAFAVKP